jgi:hypothetical protein
MAVTSAPAQMTSFSGSQFVHFGKKFAIDQSVTIESLGPCIRWVFAVFGNTSARKLALWEFAWRLRMEYMSF